MEGEGGFVSWHIEQSTERSFVAEGVKANNGRDTLPDVRAEIIVRRDGRFLYDGTRVPGTEAREGMVEKMMLPRRELQEDSSQGEGDGVFHCSTQRMKRYLEARHWAQHIPP